jgi:hypothetical protein
MVVQQILSSFGDAPLPFQLKIFVVRPNCYRDLRTYSNSLSEVVFLVTYAHG